MQILLRPVKGVLRAVKRALKWALRPLVLALRPHLWRLLGLPPVSQPSQSVPGAAAAESQAPVAAWAGVLNLERIETLLDGLLREVGRLQLEMEDLRLSLERAPEIHRLGASSTAEQDSHRRVA